VSRLMTDSKKALSRLGALSATAAAVT